ncbi:MAG: hypothetical protein JF886_02565 [Candidatus Dormibacteraeota bacterium]|uniref:Uncharacterized protein n=1 Tax=Candidatus Aeolococcus gillhamiae TaxID=3127015 RepID=A0A934K178_9BACT|nr:hypothetical protein [Candidatus Dormibacteraeota bacterium]
MTRTSTATLFGSETLGSVLASLLAAPTRPLARADLVRGAASPLSASARSTWSPLHNVSSPRGAAGEGKPAALAVTGV